MRLRVFANPIKSYKRFMEQAKSRDDILMLFNADSLETMEKPLLGWREWKRWAKRLHVSVLEIDNETTLALVGSKGSTPEVPGLKGKDETPVLVCVPRTEGAPYSEYKGSWTSEDIYKFVCDNCSAELKAAPRCQRVLLGPSGKTKSKSTPAPAPTAPAGIAEVANSSTKAKAPAKASTAKPKAKASEKTANAAAPAAGGAASLRRRSR